MFRAMLVVAALTVAATSAAATTPRWSGSASCTIVVTGPGYQHSETQKWLVNGPTKVRGAFLFVPSRWTDTGSGSSHVTQGDQTRDITWTVNAAATGQFQFVVRASDHKLLVGQANAQLRVAHGVTGTQQLTIGGVAQTPGTVDLEAFETQLPAIVTGRTTAHIAGGSQASPAPGSFGPFQPGAATATKKCAWRFNKTG